MTVVQRVPNISGTGRTFAVTVEFKLKPGATARFRKLVLENAATSMSDEPSCRRFDVLVPAEQTGDDSFLLYEIYDDRAAFDAHLGSSHFRAFDEATRDLVLAKSVREFVLLDN